MDAFLSLSLAPLPLLPRGAVGSAIKSFMAFTTRMMARQLGLVEKTVVVDGIPWTYLERPAEGVSTAGGRTTIFFHGMSMSKHEFIPCAYFLRALPGRLLLLPTWGHDDDTTRPERPFLSVDESTEWVVALVRALKLVDYNIVGYSLGASVAMQLASATYGVRRIVCLNPGFAEVHGTRHRGEG